MDTNTTSMRIADAHRANINLSKQQQLCSALKNWTWPSMIVNVRGAEHRDCWTDVVIEDEMTAQAIMAILLHMSERQLAAKEADLRKALDAVAGKEGSDGSD